MGLGSKEKIKFFQGVLIIPFQNILFLKEFLERIGCFRLLTKIKMCLALAFGGYFLHDFSIKMFII